MTRHIEHGQPVPPMSEVVPLEERVLWDCGSRVSDTISRLELGELITAQGAGYRWSDPVIKTMRASHDSAFTLLATSLERAWHNTENPVFLVRSRDQQGHTEFQAAVRKCLQTHLSVGIVAATMRQATLPKGLSDSDIFHLERLPFDDEARLHSAQLLEMGILAAKQGAPEATVKALGQAYMHTGLRPGGHPSQQRFSHGNIANGIDQVTFLKVQPAALQAAAEHDGDISRAEALEKLMRLTALAEDGSKFSLRAYRAHVGAPAPTSAHFKAATELSARARRNLHLPDSSHLARAAVVTAIAAGVTLANTPSAAAAPQSSSPARTGNPYSATSVPTSLFGSVTTEAAAQSPKTTTYILPTQFGKSGALADTPKQAEVSYGVVAGVNLAAATTAPQTPPLTQETPVARPTTPAEVVKAAAARLGRPATSAAEVSASVLGVTGAAEQLATQAPKKPEQPAVFESNQPLSEYVMKKVSTLTDLTQESPTLSRPAFDHTQQLLARVSAILQNPESTSLLTAEQKKALMTAAGTGFEPLMQTQVSTILNDIVANAKEAGSTTNPLAGLTQEQQKLMLSMLATVDLATKTPQEVQAMLDALPKPPAPARSAPQPQSPGEKPVEKAVITELVKSYGFKLSEDKEQFLIKILEAAQKGKQAGAPYNVEAVVAQAIHETGWGTNPLAKNANNIFSVKAGSNWQGEVYVMDTKEGPDHASVSEPGVAWRKYPSLEAALADYVKLIQTSRYDGATKNKDDPQKYLAGLMAGGYATDSEYVTKTLAIMNGYKIGEIVAKINVTPDKLSPPKAPAPKPAPAEGITNPTKPSECAPGTVFLGMRQTAGDGTVSLCAITMMSSTSQESTPGHKYYVEGANGHPIINAEVSQAFMDMLEAAKKDGIDLTKIPVASSFRTYEHQQDLCKGNENCRKGISFDVVSKPGNSKDNHEAGKAFDFNFGTPITINACVMDGKICNMPDKKGPGREAWEWLRDNASKYGFNRLGLEYWHYAAKSGPAYLK